MSTAMEKRERVRYRLLAESYDGTVTLLDKLSKEVKIFQIIHLVNMNDVINNVSPQDALMLGIIYAHEKERELRQFFSKNKNKRH